MKTRNIDIQYLVVVVITGVVDSVLEDAIIIKIITIEGQIPSELNLSIPYFYFTLELFCSICLLN